MTIFKKELKQNLLTLCIWSGATAFILFICVLLYPEMSTAMDDMTDLFANMGSFTAAFGMDQISFATLSGFYGVYCGSLLSIGGGFFAAMLGISTLSKEEREHTAEFLLSHPVSRASVLAQKLFATFVLVIAFNLIIVAFSLLGFVCIGEDLPVQEFLLLHLAFILLQIELVCVCFGISAFLRRGGIGIGLGLAALLYFMNLIKNITDQASFLKYLTPFAYAEASEIVASKALNTALLLIGALVTVAAVALGFLKYTKKDIAA